MSQTCQRCYKVVAHACQSDTEWKDCPNLRRTFDDRTEVTEYVVVAQGPDYNAAFLVQMGGSVGCWTGDKAKAKTFKTRDDAQQVADQYNQRGSVIHATVQAMTTRVG